MKVINFKNEPKNNPFSPEWNYFMCETQTKDINFNTIQQIFDKTNTPRTGVFEKVFKKIKNV